MDASALLQTLDPVPVRGTSLANVCVLRLDLLDSPAPGNKSFKLREYLLVARRQGVRCLVSFGGQWSNHLHALAAIGRQENLATVGIVRGDIGVPESAMLADARRWGMHIVPVSRSEYRRRADPDYLESLSTRFSPCLLVPEGGASVEGARGCMAIADLVRRSAPAIRRIVLAAGTGTTVAGIAAGLGADYEVVGVSALKGAVDLDERIAALLQELKVLSPARWRILQDFHCGGFARTTSELQDFILQFEHVHDLPLDPVYTAKMMYAIAQLQQAGDWHASEPVLAIHTGGLQGRRGYPWLVQDAGREQSSSSNR